MEQKWLAAISFREITYIILSVVAAFLVQKIVRKLFRRWRLKLPPGPRGIPFIGSFRLVNHLNIWNHRDLYGDISSVKSLGTDFVILNSVKTIREAFQNPVTAEVFAGRPETFVGSFYANEDVIFRSANSDNWKPLRQLFHTLLKTYGDGIKEIESAVGQELEILLGKLQDYSNDDKCFDFEEPLKASLANILTILAIGERFEYDDPKLLVTTEGVTLANAVSEPARSSLLLAFPFLRFLPFGPGSKVPHLSKLRAINLNILYHDFEKLSKEDISNRSGIVFELMKKQGSAQWLTPTNIEGLLQNIFGAGMLTTTSSLLTFFLLMMYYPVIQTKIQQEISDSVGYERFPTLADRNNMPFTMAVILELTRYSSAVAMSIPHMCLKDTQFKGYTIPRGAVIIPNLFRVNHDTDIWEDPWEFEPTRFLDENGHLLEPSHPRRQNLIPFGVGKRLCMGEVFAKSRIFLYITYILQKFSVKSAGPVPSKDPRHFLPGIVISPSEYKMKLKEIEIN